MWALELARNLHRRGHEVYAADTSTFHLSRFSNAIRKFFVVPSPRFAPQEFIGAVLDIVQEEKIDLLIPIWEEVLYLSKELHRFPKSCKVFCSPFELTHTLHNKWLFTKKMESLGVPAPKAVLVRSKEDLENLQFTTPFVLKECYSRAAQSTVKVDPSDVPSINIESKNPWIAQECLDGKKYCTYSVCYRGKILAHAAYPVEYTLDGSSCLAYEAVEHQGVFHWVKDFVEKVKYTGQVGFDFIETAGGTLYAIECNPRSTGGLHLFSAEERIDRAFLHQNTETIFPKKGYSRQIVAAMVMYGLRNGIKEGKFFQYLNKFFTTKDVIFSFYDLKPFLSEPLLFVAYLAKSIKLGMSMPAAFTYDLNWNGDGE